jgi:hypothetical protein
MLRLSRGFLLTHQQPTFCAFTSAALCTENRIRVDDVMESSKLAK